MVIVKWNESIIKIYNRKISNGVVKRALSKFYGNYHNESYLYSTFFSVMTLFSPIYEFFSASRNKIVHLIFRDIPSRGGGKL